MWGSSTLVITEEGLGRWGKKVSGDELFCFPFSSILGGEVNKFWNLKNSDLNLRILRLKLEYG